MSDLSSPPLDNLRLSSIDQRALELLSTGVTAAQCAAALGLSESRIAQMLSEDSFATRLAEMRFAALAKNNARDEQYDECEDQLLKQLKQVIPMVMQPEKIARLLQVVNQAKRRGSSSPEHLVQKQTVIRLQLPVQIINRFQTNAQNQVVTIENGEETQSMVTIQSGQMKKLADQAVMANQEEQNALRLENDKREKSLRQFGL